MTSGIHDRLIAETPVAVIDFETTGLTAGLDRVVEVSVVRVDPGQAPRLAFDTLVNPCRPMAATEIHGITDADVARAPTFADVAGDVVAATAGCVVAAYNVYFDIQFLEFELRNRGVRQLPPHICLMYMRPMLGLGSRCKLEEACHHHRVDCKLSHIASADAMASGELFVRYLAAIKAKGITTYGELAKLKRYKFVNSFRHLPLPSATTFGLNGCHQVVSRAASTCNRAVARGPAAVSGFH